MEHFELVCTSPTNISQEIKDVFPATTTVNSSTYNFYGGILTVITSFSNN